MLLFYTAAVSFIKNVPKKTPGKRKSRSTPLPPPIALDITETAMYESLDMADALDYTYPKPSPTSKQGPDADVYAYIPITRVTGGSNGMEGAYHMVGPDHTQAIWSHNTGPPPIPARNNSNPHFYHLLEDPDNGSILYEDPTLPTFRVRIVNSRSVLCRHSLVQSGNCVKRGAEYYSNESRWEGGRVVLGLFENVCPLPI